MYLNEIPGKSIAFRFRPASYRRPSRWRITDGDFIATASYSTAVTERERIRNICDLAEAFAVKNWTRAPARRGWTLVNAPEALGRFYTLAIPRFAKTGDES
jgi:hypothetical protein